MNTPARRPAILVAAPCPRSQGAEVRHFVDSLGQVNQDKAAVSQRVVLMVAGLPRVVKP